MSTVGQDFKIFKRVKEPVSIVINMQHTPVLMGCSRVGETSLFECENWTAI